MAGAGLSRRGALAALVLPLGALLPAAGARAQLLAPGLAARVNGQPISAERLERSFEEYLRERQINIGALRSPQRAKTLKREALDLLIDQELLWQEAQRQASLATPQEVEAAMAAVRAGFASAEAFAARLRTEGYTEPAYAEHMRRLLSARKVLEQASAGAVVGDAQVREFYQRQEADFLRPEQRRLRQLYLPFGAEADEASRARARATITALRERARAGEGDFAALAREHSRGASAAQGGDIGFVQREELAPPLAEAAFALAEGEVSDVVELPDGVHLLKVEQRIAAQRVPEAEAHERIRAHLTAEPGRQAREALVKGLRDAARIEVLLPLPPPGAKAEESFSPVQRARRAATAP